MSTMERRLQLLLDQERYDRVAAEAKASGRSVNAVIREAIDHRFVSGDDERAAAVQRLLALEPDAGEAETWAEVKASLEADLERR
jgi:predicted transcriptional regulator